MYLMLVKFLHIFQISVFKSLSGTCSLSQLSLFHRKVVNDSLDFKHRVENAPCKLGGT